MKIMSYSYKLLLCASLLLTANSLKAIEGFSLIPAGSFTMGDSLDGTYDAPTRTVTLDAYFIGKYEVTKAEWDEVRTWGLSNGYTDLAAGLGKVSNHPVQFISWYEILKWCNARSEKEGLTPVYYTNDAQTSIYKTGSVDVTNAQVKWAANGYRLPTEAEWEKAARGGLSGKRFPWGDTISHSQANYIATNDYDYDLSDSSYYHPSYKTGSTPYTSPVGAFAANGYGLYDMVGNVWEWCWDWYGTYAAGSQTNPRGSTSGAVRVLRGGSWGNGAVGVASRNKGYPSFSYDGDVGFRVARSAKVMPQELIFSHGFKHINQDDAGLYLVEANGMRKYAEWQYPPITYWGPQENNAESSLVYKFPIPSGASSIFLKASDASWDFYNEWGGSGRGCSSLEVSKDGISWVSLRNSLDSRNWGFDWNFDEQLPSEVVGGGNLWVRMRFLVEGAPNSSYTVAQFGRSTSSSELNIFEIKAYGAISEAPDSDSDGLMDSVETNTGIFVSESNTGTNPNNADTDADGVPDGLEVREGTSPVDATKFNSFSKGIVAYYPFDGSANDMSGYANHGVVNGAALSNDRLGRANAAYYFDGSNFITGGNVISNYKDGATLSCWLKSSHIGLQQGAVGKPRPYGDYCGFAIGIEEVSGTARAGLNTGTGPGASGVVANEVVNSQASIADDRWRHLLATTDGNKLVFYMDGEFIGEEQIVSDPISSDRLLQIGREGEGGPQYGPKWFVGSVDDIRAYNRALSAEEVASLYAAESPPKSSFQIIEGSYTWHEAKADAEARGGRLAVLDTQEKMNAVRDLFQATGQGNHMYIGMTDVQQEGEWKWIDGSPVALMNWEIGEPNNQGDEDFGMIYFPSATWNDGHASSHWGYLLEMPSEHINLDTDGDGYADTEETQRGSDSNDSSSYPEVYLSIMGSGGGYIEASGINGVGVWSGEFYEGYVPLRSTVTLTAFAYYNHWFSHWYGDVGDAPYDTTLVLQMDSNKWVGANFQYDGGGGGWPPYYWDSDGDGIYDDHESYHGTDPYNFDTDADGIGDGDEVYSFGTNPTLVDTDADGLTDGNEVYTHATNPLMVDTDGDLYSDGNEVQSGSNPNDPGSVPNPYSGPLFTDIANEVPSLAKHSITAVIDYDRDGKEDLLVGTDSGTRLLKQTGSFQFDDVTSASGLDGVQHAVVADFTNDGLDDILDIASDKTYASIRVNNGDGYFVKVDLNQAVEGDLGSYRDLMTGDIDNDGDIDLIYAVNPPFGGGAVAYLPNITERGAQNVQFGQKSYLVRTSWQFAKFDMTDANNDGLTDLVILQTNGNWPNDTHPDHPAVLYLGAGRGQDDYLNPDGSSAYVGFVEKADCGINAANEMSRFTSWDIDNDGDLDLINGSSDWRSVSNPHIYINDGAGNYAQQSSPVYHSGQYYHHGITIFDADADNDLDAVWTGLHNFSNIYPRMWKNEGGLAFSDATAEWGVTSQIPGSGNLGSSGYAADLDDDGDQDFVVQGGNGWGSESYYAVYRNNADQKGSKCLKIELEGTSSHAKGFGARVEVRANGKTLTQWVSNLVGSIPTTRLHFGLGESHDVEFINVYWPSGLKSSLSNPDIEGSTLKITEPSADNSPSLQIIEGSFTWHEAKADAEARGGRLAVINSEAKWSEVLELLQNAGSHPDLWIGMTDEQVEGTWKWIDGTLASNTFNLIGSDFNGYGNYGEADHAKIYRSSAQQWLETWDDDSENWPISYLLEIPNPKSVLTATTPTHGSITGAGEYDPGTTATITATPYVGYVFSGWTGDASGTDNTLSLTMDADKSVGATFEQDLADADSDGLSNYAEVVTYGSDPQNPDSDGDFLGDGFEVNNSSDPNVKTESQAYGLKIKSITKPSSFGSITNAKEIQLEGDTLAAWESSGNGNIHLFNFSEGQLTYQSSIASPDTSHDWPAFGAQMSLLGDRLVTGDPITWISGIHDGRGYQYNIQDLQNPQFEHRLDRDAQTASYIGGYVLAVNGFSIFSSSGWSDFGTQNKVHVFRENGDFYQTWTDGYNKLIEFARSPSGDAFIVSRTESLSAPAAQATKIDIYNVTDGNIQHRGAPSLSFQFSYNDSSNINYAGNQHSFHRFAFDGNKIYAIDDDYLRIFSLDDGAWNETSIDLRKYSGGSKFSSTNLLLGDDFMIVSSPNADCRDASKGCVVIFDIDAANQTLRYRETITNSSAISGEFGSYVALDEKTGHLLVSTEFGSSHAWGVVNSNNGNWIIYEGLKDKESSFQIIEGSFTWHEAKADAEARGGRLAVINSEARWGEVLELLQNAGSHPDLWIGMTDEQTEGVWKWIDGTLASDTFNLIGSDFNGYGNYGEADYAKIYGSTAQQWLETWDDDSGNWRISYLLEFSNQKSVLSITTPTNGVITGSGEYEPGATAMLTATPNAGYIFSGWIGDASGSENPLSLTMDADKTVGATFAPDYGDTDGDGLSNYEEATVYYTDLNSSDSDGDGLQDGYELGLERFTIVMGSRTWAQAKAHAESQGGMLATFASQEEWDIAMRSIGEDALLELGGLWIGATDEATEGTWKWITGESLTFDLWETRQPDNFNNSDYAAVAGDLGGNMGRWYDFRSTSTRDGYLMESGYATSPTQYDSDGDNLSDGEEQIAGTNALVADSDGDGLNDGVEVELADTDPLRTDTDGNGISDGNEDKDGDGLSNYDEVTVYNTDIRSSDSDGDGFSDGEEVERGSGPNDGFSKPQVYLSFSSTEGGHIDASGIDYYSYWYYGSYSGNVQLRSLITLTAVPYPGYVFSGWIGDASGVANPLDLQMDDSKSIQANFGPDLADGDGDGLSNHAEIITYGSDPKLADSNGDGLRDGLVVALGKNPVENISAFMSALMANRAELGLHKTEDITDMRAGSMMIERAAGTNKLQFRMKLQKSNDMHNWQDDGEAVFETPMSSSPSKQFYRFGVK